MAARDLGVEKSPRSPAAISFSNAKSVERVAKEGLLVVYSSEFKAFF